MAGRFGLMRGVGHLVTTRAKRVLIGAGVLVVAAAVFGGGVADRLTAGGFFDEGSEARRADRLTTELFTAGPSNAAFLVDPVDGFISGHAEAVAALMSALVESPHVENVRGPVNPETSVLKSWPLGSHPLVGAGGRTAIVAFTVLGSDDEVVERLVQLEEELAGVRDGISYGLTGSGPISLAARDTAEEDLTRAEVVVAPITLLALLVVFGGLVAALLPLVVAVVAILGTFVVLTIVTGFADVSIFARTLTTALGLGLGIDYSLFVVSRYREELSAGHPCNQAIERTLQTAGRTVLFSAATVAVSLAALFLFPIVYLRSFAVAGIAVVGLAALTAVLILPAVLAALGPRVDKLMVRRRAANTSDELTFWGRQSERIMRHPVPVAVGVTALLIVVALPFRNVELTRIDDRVLPADTPARVAGETIREDFSAGQLSAIEVLVIDDRFSQADGNLADRCRTNTTGVCADLDQYARALFAIGDVDNVSTERGTYSLNPFAFDAATLEFGAGEAAGPAAAVDVRIIDELNDPLAAVGATKLSLTPGVEPVSAEGEALVALVRSTPGPFTTVLVTGESARLTDTKDALLANLKWAILWIVAATYIVLLLMMGTPLIPLKALILNLLSLSATYGALVWVFQEGHLAGLLGFTATGGIDAFTPILLFCIAFGLSMDYEVFLLSRIKEEYDLSHDNDRAVVMGLSKSGNIVTAAAVLLALVFAAIGTSGVAVVKMLGVGMVIAVLTDAFLIRATLVPALMKLTGSANWWAPAWMRSWHLRWGIWEREPVTVGDSAAASDSVKGSRTS